MTTAPAPSHSRVLGRGIHGLIPSTAAASPADQAASALAALQTVTVPVGVPQAAAVLLEEMAHSGENHKVQATAAATVAMLHKAMATAAEACR